MKKKIKSKKDITAAEAFRNDPMPKYMLNNHFVIHDAERKSPVKRSKLKGIINFFYKKKIEDIVESSSIEESIAYICGIKNSTKYIISSYAQYWDILPNEIKYESIRLSSSDTIKGNIPLKELKRISVYM